MRMFTVLAMLALAGCNGGGGDTKAGPGGAGKSGPIRFPVEVRPVATQRVEYTVGGIGSVEAFEKVLATARVAGVVEKVKFKEGDTGDTNGLLLHNGVVLVNETSTSTNAVHEIVVTAAAGDKLDVAVGNKGDFTFDSTPVIFSIKSAP